jgi:hypothetical protein
MKARKRKSPTKKRKAVVIVEKQVPDFDGIEVTIRDSCALLQVASKILMRDIEDDEYGHGTVVLHHGVNLLKQAAERFDGANFRLREFFRENNLTQGGAS